MLSARIAAFLAAAFALLSNAAAYAADPVVTTRSGKVSGVAEAGGIFAFKGIPYAAPPVGDLRWRDPREPAPWQDVQRADKYGFACPQKPYTPTDMSPGDPGPMNEDCLTLNVWTPKIDRKADLPVMVWIHGGAFVIGSSGFDMTDGTPLARKGAVVVSFNYRLGQLGFFAHPALGEVTANSTANFGLMDQIAALKWVKRNIAAFGGDPDNVTIFGESAGAKSVLALFASPRARGLFHKGIAQSNYAIPDMTPAKALEMGVKVANAAGLPGADATAAQLRAIPAEKFATLEGKGLTSAPVPISGDKVLPQTIEKTFRVGGEAAVPLILGGTSDDSSVALAFGVDPAKLVEKIGAAGVVVKLLYPGVESDAERGRQVTRDLIFTMPVRWIADRHSKRAPTWRYYFDYTAEKLRPKYPNGVPHGNDILYAFDTGDIFAETKPIFTDGDRTFARKFSDYWFNFARTGEPSAKGAPTWPAHSTRADRTMEFGNDRIVAERRFMRARLNTMIGLTAIVGAVVGAKN